jgi:hypothetical protein
MQLDTEIYTNIYFKLTLRKYFLVPMTKTKHVKALCCVEYLESLQTNFM